MNGQFPLGDIHPMKYFFGISFGLGLLFAFISPDSNHPFWLTLIQWQLQTSLPMGLLILSHMQLAKMGSFNQLGVWKRVILSGILGASLFIPAALCIDIYLMGEGFPKDFWFELFDEWISVTPPVTITWILINIPWLMGLQYRHVDGVLTDQYSATSNHTNLEPNKEHSFMTLLTTNLRGEIYSLSAELHYLKVVTDKGKELILYALKDAIAGLPEQQGMQVHRSHWVSYAAIDKYIKDGRQGKLLLINGDTLPVSRSFTQTVRIKLGV